MSEKYDALAIKGDPVITSTDDTLIEERIAIGRAGPVVVASARFSLDRVYRWTLYRRLNFELAHRGRALFVMCNPSTADAFALDPTVGRCAKFARSWGYGELEVVNLYSYRSPYPTDVEILIKRAKRDGNDVARLTGSDSRNDSEIFAASERADLIMTAWGGMEFTWSRGRKIRDALSHRKLFHLGRTKDGHPKHPLARGKASILSTQEPIAW